MTPHFLLCIKPHRGQADKIFVMNWLKRFCSIMLICIIATTASCTKNENAIAAIEDEFVTVSLSLGGELRETQTPMTSESRTNDEKNDLYGIQIRDNRNSDGWYAWGIFDDLTNITVDLSTSRIYSIEITCIPNGKNLVYNYGDETNVCYDIPLNTFGWSKTTYNKFNYTSSEYLYALSWTQVYVKWENGKYTPLPRATDHGRHNAIDFYHGILSNYTPQEGGKLVVDMKRHVCALEFIAKAVEGYNYDKILLQLDSENVLSCAPKPFYITKQDDGTYSKIDLPLIMMNDLGEEDTMTISIGTDERPEEIFHGEITLKRLVKHTFEFDAIPAEDKINNGVEINKESTEFTNENTEL